VVALSLSLAYLVYYLRAGGSAPTYIYFYDLRSTAPDPLDRLFCVKNTEIPPSSHHREHRKVLPPAGVRAWVFSCGIAMMFSSRFIGTSKTSTKEYQEAMRRVSSELIKIESLCPRSSGYTRGNCCPQAGQH
jgi:hypothetical protein